MLSSTMRADTASTACQGTTISVPAHRTPGMAGRWPFAVSAGRPVGTRSFAYGLPGTVAA